MSPSWLASTADRERTVGVLRAGFAEGRLTQDELDERVARTYASRTYGELWALTADLPSGPLPFGPVSPYPSGAVMSSPAAPARAWGPAAALIVTALVIFTIAALVTAIITAHVQPGVYPGVQQAPFQQVKVMPDITRELPPGAWHVAPAGATHSGDQAPGT